MQSIPQARRRKLRTWSHSQEPNELQEEGTSGQAISLIDLASNDYLGLSRHQNLIEAARMVMNRDGVGAGASRQVTGSRPIHKELEEALAHWLGKESVLLFPSGFQANLAAVIALADRHTTVLADRLIHHSLLVGVQASGAKLILEKKIRSLPAYKEFLKYDPDNPKLCLVAPSNVEPEIVATIPLSILNVVFVRFNPVPAVYVVLDEVSNRDPLDCVVIDIFDPATKYAVPSVSRVRDPDRPIVCFVTPVKVDPDIVATTPSSIANSVKYISRPPPAFKSSANVAPPSTRSKPSPAPYRLSTDEIVIDPFDPVAIVVEPEAIK